MKPISMREWLRYDEASEASIFLSLETSEGIHRHGDREGEEWHSYQGHLTLRDCTRSASIALDDSNEEDLEVLLAIRRYADRAIKWIQAWKKEHSDD